MNNLFIAHTEYHLFLSVIISKEFYKDNTNQNKILCTKTLFRFNNINFGIFDNIEIKETSSPISSNEISNILSADISNFYYFQNGHIINRWITWQLKKTGCNIYLVEDGLAAYSYNKRSIKLLLILRDTVNDIIFLKRNGFKLDRFFITNNLRYGYNAAIDKLLLTRPEMFDRVKRKNNKEIIKIPAINSKTIEALKKIFEEYDIEYNSNVILIINQPFWNDNLIRRDIDFIKEICDRFQDRHIYIKLHPKTSSAEKLLYENLNNVKIIKSNLPAELIINCLTNSVILSAWSTALIYNNPKNKYYYYFPIFSTLNNKALMIKHIAVAKHINVVNSVDEISF